MTKLKAWRKRQKLTLADVSGLTGISIGMLSLAESGHRKFSMRAKVDLGRRLGVPIRELFEVEPVGHYRAGRKPTTYRDE